MTTANTHRYFTQVVKAWGRTARVIVTESPVNGATVDRRPRIVLATAEEANEAAWGKAAVEKVHGREDNEYLGAMFHMRTRPDDSSVNGFIYQVDRYLLGEECGSCGALITQVHDNGRLWYDEHQQPWRTNHWHTPEALPVVVSSDV